MFFPHRRSRRLLSPALKCSVWTNSYKEPILTPNMDYSKLNQFLSRASAGVIIFEIAHAWALEEFCNLGRPGKS